MRIAKREEAARRQLMEREKAGTWKLVHSWTAMTTLGGWLQILSGKYSRRRAVKKRVDRFMRILFVGLWTVGKFRRMLTGVRLERIRRGMRKVIASHHRYWKAQRTLRSKRNVARFVDEVSITPVFVMLVMFVVQRIRLVQKWYRRYLVKKRLMLSIMNRQWSATEYVVFKLKNDPRPVNERIEYCIKTNKRSEAVPVNVRIRYITQHLNVTISSLSIPN